jgi:hypothetical protein
VEIILIPLVQFFKVCGMNNYSSEPERYSCLLNVPVVFLYLHSVPTVIKGKKEKEKEKKTFIDALSHILQSLGACVQQVVVTFHVFN